MRCRGSAKGSKTPAPDGMRVPNAGWLLPGAAYRTAGCPDSSEPARLWDWRGERFPARAYRRSGPESSNPETPPRRALDRPRRIPRRRAVRRNARACRRSWGGPSKGPLRPRMSRECARPTARPRRDRKPHPCWFADRGEALHGPSRPPGPPIHTATRRPADRVSTSVQPTLALPSGASVCGESRSSDCALSGCRPRFPTTRLNAPSRDRNLRGSRQSRLAHNTPGTSTPDSRRPCRKPRKPRPVCPGIAAQGPGDRTALHRWDWDCAPSDALSPF